jgi:acetyl-CoA acetyltransferase
MAIFQGVRRGCLMSSDNPLAGRAAVVGLGLTDMGKVYGRSASDFAVDAVRRAAADAGLAMGDIDGLLINPGMSGGLGIDLAQRLGLQDLKLLAQMNTFGATAGVMIQTAAMAVISGTVNTVACVFADAPLAPTTRTGDMYHAAGGRVGFSALAGHYGVTGAAPMYALGARRHMEAFGTTTEQFGAVAVSQRRWAINNPLAQMRDPITLEDHQSSRWIAEPLHLLDCCLVSNGGIAVIVTRSESAADMAQPPVYLWGWGQCHHGRPLQHGSEFGLRSGGVESSRDALKMAGIGVADVDVLEIYDCFTYTVVVTLEDYGFCARGEGGPLAASGALGPGGSLPTNTGGGELSAYYMWGMTPISEAIIQARGHGEKRQVDNANIVMTSGNGGILEYHSTLIFGAHSRN